MTANENSADLSRVVAERFGEDVVPLNPSADEHGREFLRHQLVPTSEQVMDPRRQQVVNAIRALADFYVTHPEVPTPGFVVATSHVTSADHLKGLAARLDARVYGDDKKSQFEHDIWRVHYDEPHPYSLSWVFARVAEVAPVDRPL